MAAQPENSKRGAVNAAKGYIHWYDTRWNLILPISLSLRRHFRYIYIYTNSDGLHCSTTVPNAVGGHNTDSVYHIVGHSDWNNLFHWW